MITMKLIILIQCFLLWVSVGTAKEYPEKFWRIEKLSDNTEEFQIPVATYQKTGAPSVTLVGVIHLATPEYYQEISVILDNFDFVLYEMILDETGFNQLHEKHLKNIQSLRTIAPQKPLSLIPELLYLGYASQALFDEASSLGLAMQAFMLDYNRAHFIHADMMIWELGEAFTRMPVAERVKEIIYELIPDIFSPTERLYTEEAELLCTILDDQKSLQKLFITELNEQDTTLLFENKVIIKDRNELCLKMLDGLIDYLFIDNIGIIYGCAHMKGMHEGLLDKGYQLKNIEWIPCIQPDKINDTKLQTAE